MEFDKVDKKKVLLTGSTGVLGSSIIKSGLIENLLTPGRDELDITDINRIDAYFSNNEFDVVVHTAALARMSECEMDPIKAIETNIIGTCNLVKGILKRKGLTRFIHISTDGVYDSEKGPYSEKDATIPYNNYGWSKLASECAVNLLKDKCIIRTRFFDPNNLKFSIYATDSFTSSVSVHKLSKVIAFLINSDFVGVINIGAKRQSDYNLYRNIDPSIEACTLKDIRKDLKYFISIDSSLDTSLSRKIIGDYFD